MSFLTCDTGEILLLRYMLGNLNSGVGPQLHLFKNDITPAESNQLANYTESTAGGYSAVVLTGSSWTFSTNSGTSIASFASQSFNFSTSESIFGYYMTNRNASAVQELIWAERFPGAPYVLPSGGGQINIIPSIGAE